MPTIAPDGRPRPPGGPGRYSQRTDMSAPPTPQGAHVPTGLSYGEAKRMREAQGVAPAPNRRVRPSSAARGRGQPSAQAPITNPRDLINFLGYPTDRPNEPITYGAAPTDEASDQAAMAPWLPMLERLADSPDSTVGFRNWVRRLRGSF